MINNLIGKIAFVKPSANDFFSKKKWRPLQNGVVTDQCQSDINGLDCVSVSGNIGWIYADYFTFTDEKNENA